MSAFIDERREDFGVEPICRTLGVSASAYYQRAQGERSARAVEDERLLGLIRQVHAANYEAYGYRRTWKALLREGERVPRCRVQRLMRAHGIQGAKRRGKPWRTTRPDPLAHRRPDLVQRDFTASRPDELWVADLSYLRCWEGLVFFSFVLDAYSRKVVGWQLAPHMRTTLVLDALKMALGNRRPGADVALVHHSDRGSQPGLNRSSQRCVREMNLGTAGDGCSGVRRGTRLGWRGCRRGGSPEGRAGAAIAACAVRGPSWARVSGTGAVSSFLGSWADESAAFGLLFPVAGQRPLDRAGVHAHAEAGLDRLHQIRRAQTRVRGQLVVGERAHLVGELVSPARSGFAGHQPVQPLLVERGGGLVVGGAGIPERRGGRGDRVAVHPHPPHHLVLDLHRVAGVEELLRTERLVGHVLGMRVEAARLPQRRYLRVLARASSGHLASQSPVLLDKLCRQSAGVRW